jgi:hypothetical protein
MPMMNLDRPFAALPQALMRLRAAWRVHSRRDQAIPPAGIGGGAHDAVAVLK